MSLISSKLFKRLFSTKTIPKSPVFKIEGQCHIRLDTSDTLVLKYTLELRQDWDTQLQKEIKEDVSHLYDSSLEVNLPKTLIPMEDYESALSHIMKRNN